MMELLLSPLILLAGVFFTFKLKFILPSRLFGVIKHAFVRQEHVKGEISPLMAMLCGLAGSIGTGNIVGVAAALIIGGAGAILWMWVSAFLLFAVKYAEIYLAVLFKPPKRGMCTGTVRFIECGLGRSYKPLAVLFAVLCVFASFGVGNAVQSNAIAQCVGSVFALEGSLSTIIMLCVGVFIAAFVCLVLRGGAERVTGLCSVLVPVMGAIYGVCALIVIVVNIDKVGGAFKMIIENAFGFEQAAGGVGGFACMRAVKTGVSRGCFSHEAGMGSSPIAHASAEGSDPRKQGALGIIEIIADTFVICTLTAVMLLVSVEIPIGTSPDIAMQLVMSGFSSVFGTAFSGIMLCVCTCLFAVSSMLAWSFYGLNCVDYLTRGKGKKPFFWLYCVACIIGASAPLGIVWETAASLNLLMALPNIYALVLLSNRVRTR